VHVDEAAGGLDRGVDLDMAAETLLRGVDLQIQPIGRGDHRIGQAAGGHGRGLGGGGRGAVWASAGAAVSSVPALRLVASNRDFRGILKAGAPCNTSFRRWIARL
jgi:hypothetical protein